MRITLLKQVTGVDLEAVSLHRPNLALAPLELPIKVYATAGTILEGVVSDLDDTGLFDLNFDDGRAIGFYADDSAIMIEVLSES